MSVLFFVIRSLHAQFVMRGRSFIWNSQAGFRLVISKQRQDSILTRKWWFTSGVGSSAFVMCKQRFSRGAYSVFNLWRVCVQFLFCVSGVRLRRVRIHFVMRGLRFYS